MSCTSKLSTRKESISSITTIWDHCWRQVVLGKYSEKQERSWNELLIYQHGKNIDEEVEVTWNIFGAATHTELEEYLVR